MQLPDIEQYMTKAQYSLAEYRIQLHLPKRTPQDSLEAGRETVRMLDLRITEKYSYKTGKYGSFVKRDCLDCEMCTKTDEKI